MTHDILTSVAKKFARFTVAMIVVLVILELTLRIFGYGSYIIYEPDPKLLWVPSINQEGLTVDGRESISINNVGLRYPFDVSQRNSSEFRIVSFGDSITMGWGVDDSSHYSAILEQHLRRQTQNDGIRVLSAGVNAYPVVLCVDRFEVLLEQGFQIDFAVLAYSFNHKYSQFSQLKGKDRQEFLQKVRVKSYVRRLALYNFLIEDLLREAVYYRVRNRLAKGSWEKTGAKGSWEKAEQSQQLVEHVNSYHETIQKAVQLASRHNVGLIMLLLGSKGQKEDLNHLQIDFLDSGRQFGIPVVNMVERFSPLDHEELFVDHVHPSAEGHNLIGIELSRALGGMGVPFSHE